MTLQSAIEQALPQLRAEAEARMTSKVTVYRNTGRVPVANSVKERDVWDDIYTDLPFRLHPGTERRTISVGGVEREESVRTGSLPALGDDGQPLDVRDGDRLLITVGEYEGAVYRVVDGGGADQMTARRLALIADSAPNGGWS